MTIKRQSLDIVRFSFLHAFTQISHGQISFQNYCFHPSLEKSGMFKRNANWICPHFVPKKVIQKSNMMLASCTRPELLETSWTRGSMDAWSGNTTTPRISWTHDKKKYPSMASGFPCQPYMVRHAWQKEQTLASNVLVRVHILSNSVDFN